MTLQSAHTIYREAIRWKDIDIIFIQMAQNENLEKLENCRCAHNKKENNRLSTQSLVVVML
jgi:hypothetical protein